MFLITPLIVVPLVGCQAPTLPPSDALSAGETQSSLAVDSEQANLWLEAARSGATPGIQNFQVRDAAAALRPRLVVQITDQPAEQQRLAFPADVPSGLAVLGLPDIDRSYTGVARVSAVDGEFVTLDLGESRLLELHAKVRGGPVRARPGETAELMFRQGDPYERNDLLAVKLEDDDLLYTLVGGNTPVRLSISSHGLNAVQLGEPDRNMMNVRVTIGSEARTLRAGDEAIFSQAGLTVKVLASVAVQGEAANALEGEPYRLELLGWRTTAR